MSSHHTDGSYKYKKEILVHFHPYEFRNTYGNYGNCELEFVRLSELSENEVEMYFHAQVWRVHLTEAICSSLMLNYAYCVEACLSREVIKDPLRMKVDKAAGCAVNWGGVA